jgi:predicted transcriptional regulator
VLPNARRRRARFFPVALDRLGENYVASDDELATIDEALAQTAHGEFASEAEIEAAFARSRK